MNKKSIFKIDVKQSKTHMGITLIALIITIVVLLIIAVVAVGAVNENDIIGHAQDAKSEYIAAQEQEQIGLAVSNWQIKSMLSSNQTTFKSAMETAFQDQNVTITGEEDGPLYILFNETPNGGYTVESNGKITSGKVDFETVEKFNWSSVNLNTLDLNAAYKGSISAFNVDFIISFTEDGKVIIEDSGYITEINAKDSNNIDEETGNLSFSIQIGGMDSNVVVTQNGNNKDLDAQITVPGVASLNITAVKAEGIYSHKAVLERLGITSNTGNYNGTWTAIGTEGGKTKLVSTSNVTSYKLGYEDLRAVGNTELEKAIWSYKNVESTLKAATEKATGIQSARSITVEDIETLEGIQDSDKGEEYNKEERFIYGKYTDHIFIDNNDNTVVLDQEGKQISLRHTYYSYQLSKEKVGTLVAGNYWLASKSVYFENIYISDGPVSFGVRYVNRDGKISSRKIFSSNGDLGTDTDYNVRAIVYI